MKRSGCVNHRYQDAVVALAMRDGSHTLLDVPNQRSVGDRCHSHMRVRACAPFISSCDVQFPLLPSQIERLRIIIAQERSTRGSPNLYDFNVRRWLEELRDRSEYDDSAACLDD
jgi:hypothetical protein